MILGPVSLVDCLIFVVFLIPQLLIQTGPVASFVLVFQVLPFLIFKMPFQFIHERFILDVSKRSPFCRRSTLFQDIVIRCVRYAFANIPAQVGRVFFSKWVIYPFFRFRLFRHGFLRSPMYYKEVVRKDFKGLWIINDSQQEPDIIIYYCHGGGFSMGSAWFYQEFLMAWATRLMEKGYKNPAVFALDYTLVPDAKWPTQFNETRAGYRFLLDSFGDGIAQKICVSGDSAGGTLVLSMLLQPGNLDQDVQLQASDRPGLAVLLSPWTHLVSELNQNTPSDYLNRESMHLYAKQYAGESTKMNEIISPGLSLSRWKRASPVDGYRMLYGSEEVLLPGIEETVRHIKKDGATVKTYIHEAGIHAWPVVNLFLGETRDERMEGLDVMTNFIVSSNMAPA